MSEKTNEVDYRSGKGYKKFVRVWEEGTRDIIELIQKMQQQKRKAKEKQKVVLKR